MGNFESFYGKKVGSSVNKEVKFEQVTLTASSVTSGSSKNFSLPSKFDDKEVLAIIPISVGALDTWGSACPAVITGSAIANKIVVLRAYATQNYAPQVCVIYKD